MDGVKINEESAHNGFQTTSDPQPVMHQSSTPCDPIEVHFDEIDGFEWNDELEKILTSLARTGLPSSSSSWSTILKALLYSLKNTIQNYVKLGSSSLFDTREEPAGGWLWTPEDLQKSIDRIYLALKDFSGHQPEPSQCTSHYHPIALHDQIQSIRSAPFTIQRLTELMFPSSTPSGIHPHYKTLPKYLRAIQHVLSVSSPVISYAINTFMLSHLSDYITSLSAPPNHLSTSSYANGGNLSTIPPSSPRPRRYSTSTPITPVLSPIPWLVNSERHDTLSPEVTSSDGRHSRHTSPLLLSSGCDERPITPPLMSVSSPPLSATTPPQTLSSSSPPRTENPIISPTPINRTSTTFDLSREEILTSPTAGNETNADQAIDCVETVMISIDDTPIPNGVTSHQDHASQPDHELIPNQSQNPTMDETP